MWLFENDFGVPVEDNRVIAPNGKAKIIFPYINGLSTTLNGVKTDYKDQEIYFIGIWDKPVTLSSYARVTGTIGIELKPNAVHRFAKFSMLQMTNRIFSFSELYGQEGRALIERLTNTINPFKKAELLQAFLLTKIEETNRENKIIDYTVELIKTTSGLIEVKELESKTGYSKRYLDLLFRDHLGVSPKTLSSILRFQSFYKAWANTETDNFYKDNYMTFIMTRRIL